MNPVKLIRSIGKILRGGSAPREIFLGFFLGFAIGMIPGFNLTSLIFIALLLFLNVNAVVGALAIVLGKLIAAIFAPLIFQLGYAMIHSMGLSGLVVACSETPVLAFLNLQIYCLMGALPLIIILGIPGAICTTKLIKALRMAVVSANTKSKFIAKLSNIGIIKLLLRIVFGKKKGDMAEANEKKSPLFNIKRIIVAGVLIAVIVVFSLLFMDPILKAGLTRGIEVVNGAEVNIDSVTLSLSEGRLEIKGLQVTDPAAPENNSVQAESIVGEISVRDLLTKRLVINEISCDAMALDRKREKAGEVFLSEEEITPKEESIIPSIGGLGDLQKYKQQVEDFNKKLESVKEYLNKRGEESASSDPAVQKEYVESQAQAKGYSHLSADELLAKKPNWLIVKGAVTRVSLAENFPTFTIEAANLSNNPSLVEEKPYLIAKPDDTAFKEYLKKFGLDDVTNKVKKQVEEKTGGLLDKFNPFKKKQ